MRNGFEPWRLEVEVWVRQRSMGQRTEDDIARRDVDAGDTQPGQEIQEGLSQFLN